MTELLVSVQWCWLHLAIEEEAMYRPKLQKTAIMAGLNIRQTPHSVSHTTRFVHQDPIMRSVDPCLTCLASMNVEVWLLTL